MSLPATLSKSTALRSIILKVKPAPTSLSERRALLRVLKKHGEIDVFLKLRDPLSYVSITRQADVASKLVAKSPLQFDVDSEPAVRLPSSRPSPNDNQPSATVKKTFTVHVFSGEKFPHFRLIEESPLFGPWPDERSPFDKTAFQHDGLIATTLRTAVPKDMAAIALRDWETGTTPPTAKTSPQDYVAARKEKQRLRKKPGRTLGLGTKQDDAAGRASDHAPGGDLAQPEVKSKKETRDGVRVEASAFRKPPARRSR
ncbi:hypothetical protein QBC47DRAFT_403231 [Echria macrotheca]|uniref:Uncharacterized protein n=1 Tax=Echria macrotheca TaxID=438768 RepID=A0AAJ0BAS2_9PEZI|nr:hypothetical protein QBC47DRAFT_403231 [Echria macrotheca]